MDTWSMGDLALPIRSPPELALAGRFSSDERLARLISQGSSRAFTVLYQRHHQALYRYCRSIVRDHDDAQEALQSTMCNAFLALRASERDVAVRPWLFRIAHNEAVSILRKRHHSDALEEEHERSEESVERTVDQRERLRSLVSDIQELPERQRAVLLMRELSGLPIEQIAAALSVSHGAAKQTLFEARSSLHEFAEGRVMECETVRRAISDGDGRVLRGRRLRAHLRGCAGCRDFRALIDTRTAGLRALVPALPAGAAAAMLTRVLAHGTGGGHGAGTAAASGAALGGHTSASLVVKGIVGAAVLAAASGGTLHLVTGPAKHGHTSSAPAAVVGVHAGGSGRASVAAQAGTRGNSRQAAVALGPRTHISAGHGTVVSSGIQPETRHSMQSLATPTAGGERAGSHHIHGNAHRTSGEGSRGSHKGQLALPRSKHSPRTHGPSKPSGSSASPQAQSRSHSGGNGHTPQAHQAPVGQPPAAGEKGNEAHHQPATAPITPPGKHGNNGK
jgi:RNA polymerase sigma factor (sigma-70 family)